MYNYPQVVPYMQRLWCDYAALYWNSGTVGFSVSQDITGSVFDYVSVPYQGSILPAVIDLHIYDNVPTLLQMAYDSIRIRQQIYAYWLIGETYYNDRLNAEDFRDFANSHPGLFDGLVQWPLKRFFQGCQEYPDPADKPPSAFDNYRDYGW